MKDMTITVSNIINPVLVIFKVATLVGQEWCFFRIIIDDEEMAVSHHHGSGTNEVFLTCLATLDTGNHVIKGQWRSENGQVIRVCGWGSQSGSGGYKKNVTRHLIVIEL